MATYAKDLAKRASLTEGSARVAKSYKVKVTSLTSEMADLQAQIRELTEVQTPSFIIQEINHRIDFYCYFIN